MNKSLIVITGASSGIGAAMAHIFSDAGYPLALLARNLDAMQAFNLPNTLCQSVDVTDYEAMQNAIHVAENQYGPVDCMINNAGFLKTNGRLIIQHDPRDFMLLPKIPNYLD